LDTLLGGMLAFIGFSLFPNNPMSGLAWLAFLLDWGSLPGIAHAIVYNLKKQQVLDRESHP
jgi:hypothetical protein